MVISLSAIYPTSDRTKTPAGSSDLRCRSILFDLKSGESRHSGGGVEGWLAG